MKKKFVVLNNGLRIKGKVYLPDDSKKLPAIIISHEFGMNMLSTTRYAVKLYKLGYAVFIFDFCGSGAGISDGKSINNTLFTEKEDLNCVLDYVKSLDYVDSEHITLMGCSQGGLVSALLAAERESEIEKLVLCYPALSIPDDARRGSMLGAKFTSDNLPEKFQALYVKLGRGYIESALALEPWREICTYSKPVLILHGDKDGIVPFSYAETANGKYPNSRLVRIKNAHHIFPVIGFGNAISAIREFLS